MRSWRGFGASVALCLSLIGPGLLAPIPAAAAGDLAVQGVATWDDSQGLVHVMGEVVNNGTVNYKTVMAQCTLVDGNGKTLMDSVPIEAEILKGNVTPAEKAPFDAHFYPGPGSSQPSCTASGAATPLQPNHRFSAVIDSVQTGTDGYQHVVGTLTNNNAVPESNIKVILTSYDPANPGTVLDEGVTWVEGPVAGNGGTAAFDLNSNLRPWDTTQADYASLGETLSPVVYLSATSLSFGDQVQGTSSALQTVYVNNFGTAELNVSSVILSGPNWSDYLSGAQDNCSGATVEPGGSCRLAIRFTPQGTGASSASLLVYDDASDSPQTIALSGSGLKRPALSLSASTLDFGRQNAGTSSATTVQVTSTGLDPLAISSITLDNTQDFAVDGAACLSGSLAPGASCQLTVTFHPVNNGLRTGTITIQHNGRNSPSLITLSGTGLHAAPAAALLPDHLTFGQQLVGVTSPARTVTLSNNGTGPMTITGISASGDFALVNHCDTSLVAGASCSIDVTFTPTALGDRTGALTVTDDAGSGSQSIPLSGTGTNETDFYFAEGFTGPGFQESLSLLIPNHNGTATIDYYLNGGTPITKTIDLTAGQVAMVDVNAAVGANKEVSVRVKLPLPGVVERIMHFRSGAWFGSTDIVGVTHTASEWDFAEGSTLGFFSEFLTLQNPNPAPVIVDLNYMTDVTGNHPTRTLTLPPTSRTTVAVSDPSLGVGPGIAGVSVSVVAHSGAQIIAERPFYVNGFSFGSGAIRDGHVAFGANAPAQTWNFAEGTTIAGFNEYLTLQNPQSTPTTAHLHYFTDANASLTKTLVLPANSRVTVEVFRGNLSDNPNCSAAAGTCGVGSGVAGVSTQVTATQPIVAERPIYIVHNFGTGTVAGAHVVVGSNAFGTLFGFAAASAVAGENDFLTIQNANTVQSANAGIATVSIRYYTPTGFIDRQVVVNPNSRQTVAISSTTGGGAGPGIAVMGIVVTSNVPVMVEKPTYSSNTPTYGATDTLGYSPPGF